MPFLDSKTHITRKAIFALLMASMIWGISTPIIKWMLFEVPPFTLGFFRFFVASSFMFLIFRPNLAIQKKHIPTVILAAIIGITIHISLFFFAIRLTSSVNAAIIASASPIIVVIGAALFLKEHITKGIVMAGILGTIGVSIIIADPLAKEGISSSFIGNMLLLVGLFFGVGYGLTCKYLFRTYQPMTITFYSFFIGGALFFPLMLIMDQFPTREMMSTPNFYLGVPFGIVFPSIMAFGLWQWGLSKLPASRVGFFSYLDPVITGIAAFFILGEIVELPVIIGSVFILCSLYFAESKHPYHHLIDIVRNRETEYKHQK